MSAPTITTTIDGDTITRDQVLQWENRRITAAARKLDVHVNDADDVATRRDALLQAKLDLGANAIAARLARATRVAGWVARAEAWAGPRRRLCVTDLTVSGGNAEQFVDAFSRWSETSDETAMLRACPDHFVIRTGADGRQQVVA